MLTSIPIKYNIGNYEVFIHKENQAYQIIIKDIFDSEATVKLSAQQALRAARLLDEMASQIIENNNKSIIRENRNPFFDEMPECFINEENNESTVKENK